MESQALQRWHLSYYRKQVEKFSSCLSSCRLACLLAGGLASNATARLTCDSTTATMTSSAFSIVSEVHGRMGKEGGMDKWNNILLFVFLSC